MTNTLTPPVVTRSLSVWQRTLMLLAPPLILLAFAPTQIIDDAYISFRYARNLALGRGLVFNAGEYVEGFSNLLWTLMMAIPELVGLPVDVAAFCVGIGFAVLAFLETRRLATHLGVSAQAATAALVLLALFPPFWRAAANGLEGGLVAFLLTRTICLVLLGKTVGASLSGGLLFLTRPDTLLVIPLAAFAAAVARWTGSPHDGVGRMRIVALLWPWAATVAAITTWRLVYYDAWLPNTVSAKSPPISLASDAVPVIVSNIQRGLAYCAGYSWSALPIVVSSLMGVWFAARYAAVWLCLAVLGVNACVVLLNGGDWMPHHRLLAPYTPLLAVLSAVGIHHMSETVARAPCLPLVRWRVPIVAIVLVGISAVMLGANEWKITPRLMPERPARCWQELARLLDPVLMSTDRVSPEALGIFSYRLMDVRIHDFLGLTDRHVARNGTIYVSQYGKMDPEYTYDVVKPEVVIIHSRPGALYSLYVASAGDFNRVYGTYSLAEVPGCSDEVAMSVRLDVRSRILQAFEGVPLRSISEPWRRGF